MTQTAQTSIPGSTQGSTLGITPVITQASAPERMQTTDPGPAVPPIDPMPAGKLAMWLFLSSEAMFFTGLLGALIVLSSGEQHELYRRSAHMLSRSIGVASIVCLVASSLAMLKRSANARWVAVGISLLFIVLQMGQAELLRVHHTIVYRQGGKVLVADGVSWDLRKMEVPVGFDIHRTTADNFQSPQPVDEVLSDNDYGPSRNNYFASYFVLSGSHVLHLIAGMIAVMFYLVRRRGVLPPAVQIYWHFVNTAGAVCLLALYFV